MREPLTTIRNVGPAMAASLRRAGIAAADVLRALGPDAAYAHVLEAGDRPHLMAFQALATGIEGRRLGDLSPAEKADLRKRFEAIKAHRGRDAVIEAALDPIGVGPRRG